MPLGDKEKEEIKALIDAGQPLPDKYRALVFAEPRETELIWPGKTSEVTNVVLPFQSIEQIDEPRAEAGKLIERPHLTGGYILENEWQSSPTRKSRALELTTAPREYPAKGRYKIAVKVIDNFGNDTTKVVEVVV